MSHVTCHMSHVTCHMSHVAWTYFEHLGPYNFLPQGTSTATLNGTPVVGRYYFFSVSIGSILTMSRMQPNNATITITHSVSGLPGYNGEVELDGAVITFTDSVLIPTLIHYGGQWLLSLPNNDPTWQVPVFGGGSLVQVLDPSPASPFYSFTMTSDSADMMGAAWLWSM